MKIEQINATKNGEPIVLYYIDLEDKSLANDNSIEDLVIFFDMDVHELLAYLATHAIIKEHPNFPTHLFFFYTEKDAQDAIDWIESRVIMEKLKSK